MNETLTLGEIESRFHSEWILVADPEVDEHLNVLRGKVVAHSADRNAVYERAVELRLKRSALLYTGKITDGVVVLI